MRKIPLIILGNLMVLVSAAQKSDSIKSVNISEMTWMKTNLNVSAFRNGDLIPQAQSFEEWKKAGESGRPAWCYFDNNPANGSQFGRIYNWYAVNDPRGLAPTGWHIAKDEEWYQLTENLDASQIKSSSGWAENGNGTNESGLNALPGGKRGFMSEFQNGFLNIGYIGAFWTATESGDNYAWGRIITENNSNMVSRRSFDKGEGMYVRCVKDK